MYNSLPRHPPKLKTGKALDSQQKDDDSDWQDSALVDVEELLTDCDWKSTGDAAALEARFVGELRALEAANVHAIIESEESVSSIITQIDKAVQELAALDSWLTVYSNELNARGKDVHQIESRNKGLQVQTVNQKHLLTELDAFLYSITVPESTLDTLRQESLESVAGVAKIEEAAADLQRVLLRKFDEGVQNMQAFKERMEHYNFHSNNFSNRMYEFLKVMFIFHTDQAINDKSRATYVKRGQYSFQVHHQIEEFFTKYRGLTLWMKEMDPRKLVELQQIYVSAMNNLYCKEIHDLLDHIRSRFPKKIAEDPDYVFNSIVTSYTGPGAKLAATAAVSRSNLAVGGGQPPTGFRTKPLRNRGFLGSSNALAKSHEGLTEESSKPGLLTVPRLNEGDYSGGSTTTINFEEKLMPDEAFRECMALIIPAIACEQNFASDMFHVYGGGGVGGSANSASGDRPYKTFQSRSPVASRKLEDLTSKREATKDVKVQKRISELMDGVFDTIPAELTSFMEVGVKLDATNAIGMLVAAESFLAEYASSNQSFIVQLMTMMQRRLKAVFEKFVEEQMKAIDERNITSKKRTGIVQCVRVFPNFVERMEDALGDCTSSVRGLVDSATERLVRRVFDTMEAIAKAADVADEKEMMNIQILTLENMHYFYSEMRGRKMPVLEPYVRLAKQQYDGNLSNYVKDVIRRPLGKLLEFFEGIEMLLRTGAPEEVGFHINFNKAALRKVVAQYPGKEIKKGLETLYKRVDKHFSEEAGLLQVVWRGIQEEFIRRHERFTELISRCYPDSGVVLEFSIKDLLGYFSDLAKTH